MHPFKKRRHFLYQRPLFREILKKTGQRGRLYAEFLAVSHLRA
jgi:hypothetical protein